MRIYLIFALALAGLVVGRPQDLKESISSVLKSLAVEEEDVVRTRPRIITKYDFMQTRNKKSHLDLPPEFVISTDLQTEGFRSGRSHGVFGPSRRAKAGFSDIASAVRNAPLVQGVRVPDDETDLVVHRGGRFINNEYVPHESQIPKEFVVRAELGPRPVQVRAGRSYQSEGYQGNDYTFSPLQHYEQQQQLQQGLPTVMEADQDDFLIQEQTYQLCPGCPTFSVPVPVPKATEFYQQEPEQKSLFSRLADMVSPAIETAREFFRGAEGPVDTISSRVDSGDYSARPQHKLTTPLLTSLAAVGFGLTSFFSSRLSGASGRQFEDDAEQLMNSIDHEFSSLSQSGLSVDDILCLPRQYCDKLKAQKHLLDQYPNMKTVAAWMTEKYFENVAESSSEYYSHGQCNIKQCLQELLN